MSRQLKLIAVLFALTWVGCGPAREGMEGHQDIVAQVDGHSLTVDRAARLLAAGDPDMVPLQPEAVDRLVEVWIGYTILASELAQSDSFSGLDTDALSAFARDQELVWSLQERVIIDQVAPTEEELRAEYEREQPYTRADVRHILIRVERDADAAAEDSALQRAREIRRRAEAGEDFEELARRYSDDTTSRSGGGSLGWVDRGRLMDPLDETIFSLEVGEVSEPIRSVFGYHIIKVVDRENPDFESRADDYRQELLSQRMRGREGVYIDSLFEAADPRFARGFHTRVKQLATATRLGRLSRGERRAPLVRYNGGALTVGEWADFVIRAGSNARSVFASRDSAGVATLLREMVRNELLVRAAREEGIELAESTRDSLNAATLRNLQQTTLAAGLRRQVPAGEATSMTRNVDRALVEVITRQRGQRPVERLYPDLKRGHVINVYPHRFKPVLKRLAALREGSGENEPEPGAPSEM